jgi:hypothetical protein
MLLLGSCGYVGYGGGGGASDAQPDAIVDASVDAPVDLPMDAPTPWPPRFRDLCAFAARTVILDGNGADDATSMGLNAALGSACGPGASVRTVSETDAGILDHTTRAPLLGPTDLGLAGGGDMNAQDVMTYLVDLAPLEYALTGSVFQVFERGSTTPIVDVARSSITTSHDYAIVQLIHDPASDSVVLSAFGVIANGTRTGAFWLQDHAASLTTDSNRWHVIEWTNGDGTPQPSAGDTFTLIASGG